MHYTEPWRNSSWHYPVQLQPPASQTCGKKQGQEWVLSQLINCVSALLAICGITHCSCPTSQRWRWCNRRAAGGNWNPPSHKLPCLGIEANLQHWAQGAGSAPPRGPTGPRTDPTSCWGTSPPQQKAHAGQKKQREALLIRRSKEYTPSVDFPPSINNSPTTNRNKQTSLFTNKVPGPNVHHQKLTHDGPADGDKPFCRQRWSTEWNCPLCSLHTPLFDQGFLKSHLLSFLWP